MKKHGSHTPHGVCGLKQMRPLLIYRNMRHTPHGVCGLKPIRCFAPLKLNMSHPAWGVWIETRKEQTEEMNRKMSHPAWGVWIETFYGIDLSYLFFVTPRMGCVD